MFTSSPFAELSAMIPPAIMQTYIIVMILLVAGGTLFDILHKRSLAYFIGNWRLSRDKASKPLSGGDMASMAFQTVVVEILASGEFCKVKRRIAHLLTFYGFLLYIITTIIMVFSYPTPETPAPAILPLLWNLGALMILAGGYWFWFFLRVDVAYEGHSPFRLVRADLFVVSLLFSVTAGFIWAILQAAGSEVWATIFLGLYIISTTVLFASVPWSKFSHMFYKPAAAFQKRVEEANGSSKMPAPAEFPRGEV